ncbi:baseplate J/gp47 family protein [Clostridium oryzae]|uniref:Baseplate J-like protein n=1 Tax=Clostridium oryzae TaxID=1450648 RepID=A0A1V4IEK2_9CLOT|nr:baseplate J/gp47 family protein [Clostridium oryzae]OPJ58432.1 baseplate J-like protein [Clostridium oryzae]
MYSEDSEDILDRMLEKVPSDADSSEGSFIFDSLSPISQELAQSKIQLDEVLNRVFAISAAKNGYSDELELKASEFGITRKAGTKASLENGTEVYGSDNTVIPAGSIFQTEGGLQYKTLAEATIVDGKAVVDVEATDIGNKYNVPAGIITEVPIQILGVTGVKNISPVTGGTEEEADEDLLDRLLLKVKTPATSGNAGHYKIWATEVNGVGDAIVISLSDGPGTVKVILLDSNKHTPSEQIIESVKKHIEENRPIGAAVTVQGAVEVPVNVNVTLQLASGATLETVKTQIEQGLKDYLEILAFNDPLVRYTRIANVLMDIPPIIDYSSLTVNNGTANIEIAEGSVAVLGSVVVTSA